MGEREAGTCGTCRWWRREHTVASQWHLHRGVGGICESDLRAEYTWQHNQALYTQAEFGCNQYEPKLPDWEAVARELKAAAIEYAKEYNPGKPVVERFHAALNAIPDEPA